MGMNKWSWFAFDEYEDGGDVGNFSADVGEWTVDVVMTSNGCFKSHYNPYVCGSWVDKEEHFSRVIYPTFKQASDAVKARLKDRLMVDLCMLDMLEAQEAGGILGDDIPRKTPPRLNWDQKYAEDLADDIYKSVKTKMKNSKPKAKAKSKAKK